MRDEERTVSNIAKQFSVSRPAISQHLRVLQDAELVNVRTEGTRRYYRARPEGLVGLSEWMQEMWGSALEDLAVEAGRDDWKKRGASSGAAAATGSDANPKSSTVNDRVNDPERDPENDEE